MCFMNRTGLLKFTVYHSVLCQGFSQNRFLNTRSCAISNICPKSKHINASNLFVNLYTGKLSKYFNIRKLSTNETARKFSDLPKVLGIETSCDDTGAAVVNSDGQILGDSLNSQTKLHTKFGGILPRVARDLHDKNIKDVVEDALQKAHCNINDVDAIAATVKPGMTMSLNVGFGYAKELVKQSGKPFIPIHHMEAHALTARMIDKEVEFPFVTLLLSGGHCLLALVRDVEDFALLGQSIDDAPGDAFDKTARRLRLRNIPEFSELSGGRAIEILAERGDPTHYDLVSVLAQHADCNFSFSGLKTSISAIIEKEEQRQGTSPAGTLTNLPDICASFQYFVLYHIAKRLQRGFLFCELHNLLPENNRSLVVSGGVASNLFIRAGLERVCQEFDCKLVCPPPHLCTDNGIMIAWNGIEKFRRGLGITDDIDAIKVQNRCPLGEDWTERVPQSFITKMPKIKLLP